VGQRRVEDDDIEGFILEGQGPGVGLLKGEVGQVRGQVAGFAQQRGRHVDAHHLADVGQAGKRPRQHPRLAAHLKYVRVREEGHVGEEVAAQGLLPRIGATSLEDAGKAFLHVGVEFGKRGPHIRHKSTPW
jgi:hypothetical protein